MKKHAKSHRQQKARKRQGSRALGTAAAETKRPGPVAGTVAVSPARSKAARLARSNETDRAHGAALARTRNGAQRRAATQAIARDDDRAALALLMAPFLIVALFLVAERSLRDFAARVPVVITSSSQPMPTARSDHARTASLERHAKIAPPAAPLPSLEVLIAPPLPSLATLISPPLPSLELLIAPPLPSLATLISPPLPSLEVLIAPPLPSLATLISPSLPSLGLLIDPPLPILATLIDPATRLGPPICEAKPGYLAAAITPGLRVPPSSPTVPSPDFGRALSDAARTQLADFVIYNPKYVRIAYPMGDVPAMFGVCTDVIVRAYRAVGVDLQALVQETRSGTGDRNIDHRRVEVVRRFLARHGQSLPISDLAESYQPGDIVTYHRPQNRTTTAHIAIVTDQIAPSGRPMIVHNRGWGPQMEDALFVDRITGHYRFQGLALTRSASTDIAPAARLKRLAKQASRQIR